MDNIPENKFAVIMPAYNEAGRIGVTIAGIRKSTDADIIVVSDGSIDNTDRLFPYNFIH